MTGLWHDTCCGRWLALGPAPWPHLRSATTTRRGTMRRGWTIRSNAVLGHPGEPLEWSSAGCAAGSLSVYGAPDLEWRPSAGGVGDDHPAGEGSRGGPAHATAPTGLWL